VNEVDAGNPLWAAATLILPLVLAIVCHEVSHGAVARLLGDRTAAEQGRLTLNPIAHVDWFGTVILPGMLALAHLTVFGWAKPVPVDFRRLRNPRLGMMLVAAAGPLSNLLLAAGAAVGIGAIAGSLTGKPAEFGFASFCLDNLRNFLAVNLFLALFNLLPVPPFDGGHVVEGLLPPNLAREFRKIGRFSLLVLVVLLLVLPRLSPSADVVGRFVSPLADGITAAILGIFGLTV